LLTSWSEFSDLPNILKSTENNILLIDGRRMLSKDSVSRYEGIGV
jgi:hypothetical protein